MGGEEHLSDLRSLDVKPIWDGVAARIVQGERITFAVVELDPGAVVPDHEHANEPADASLAHQRRRPPPVASSTVLADRCSLQLL